jgi:ADP-ribose pyrophosphatase YjhB (NUDIX family)
MWLITPIGFFSIVEKSNDIQAGTLTIRSRVASDLDDLRKTCLPELGLVMTGTGTDYRFRATAPRAAVAQAMSRIIEDLHYSNFKTEVAKRQGRAREAVYHKVWDNLNALQSVTKSRKPIAAPIAKADSYGGILIDDDERILLREPRGHYGGYAWTFPKGKSDPGETSQETALREVKEETGYDAAITGILDGTFVGDTGSTAFYLMKPVGAPSGPTPETVRIKWASLDEARKLICKTKSVMGRRRDLSIVDVLAKSVL